MLIYPDQSFLLVPSNQTNTTAVIIPKTTLKQDLPPSGIIDRINEILNNIKKQFE
jgi:hypothetical protein